jgi:phospholipase D-like protein
MVRLALFLVACDLVLLCLALIDCLAVEKDRIRALPRALWLVLIVLVSPVGPITWYLFGRPQRTVTRVNSHRPRPLAPNGRSRGPAPDDDPEFLASLGRLSTREDEMLRAWEDDLRPGEEEPRRPDDDPDTPPAAR